MHSNLRLRIAMAVAIATLLTSVASAADRRPDRTDGPEAARGMRGDGPDGMRMPGGMPPGPGFRGPGGPGFMGPPGPRGPRPEDLEALGLTDAQRAKLDALRDTEMRQVIPIEADLRIAELDLEKAITADRPEAAAVNAIADRVSALRARMFRAHLETRMGLQSILTPDQRAKLRRGPPR